MRFFKIANPTLEKEDIDTNKIDFDFKHKFFYFLDPNNNQEYFFSDHIANYWILKFITNYFLKYILGIIFCSIYFFIFVSLIQTFSIREFTLWLIISISYFALYYFLIIIIRKIFYGIGDYVHFRWRINGSMIPIEIRYKLVDHYNKLDHTRICYKCKREIGYFDYLFSNYNFFRRRTIKKLTKIWESSYIQLYCCECYSLRKVFEFRIEQFIKEIEMNLKRSLKTRERKEKRIKKLEKRMKK